METIIGYGLWALIVGALLWDRHIERVDRRKRESELLDRIMATDYTQYAAVRVNTMKVEEEMRSAVSPNAMEELKRYLEEQEAQGIPI